MRVFRSTRHVDAVPRRLTLIWTGVFSGGAVTCLWQHRNGFTSEVYFGGLLIDRVTRSRGMEAHTVAFQHWRNRQEAAPLN